MLKQPKFNKSPIQGFQRTSRVCFMLKLSLEDATWCAVYQIVQVGYASHKATFELLWCSLFQKFKTRHNGSHSTTRLANHNSPRIAIFNLTRSIWFVSNLFFESLDIEASILSSIWSPTWNHKARHALFALREGQKSITHGCGGKPLMTNQPKGITWGETRVVTLETKTPQQKGLGVGKELVKL